MATVLDRPTKLPIVGFGQPDQGFSTMRVTSPFAERSDGFHAALDIGNFRAGDIVTAAADATVYGVGHLRYPWSTPDSRWGTGNTGGLMIVLRVSSRIFLVYAHLASEFVSLGQIVKVGQAIGTLGDSGSARNAAHLHYAVVVASENTLATLAANRRTVPRENCRDPWPLITRQMMLSTTGQMIPYQERKVMPFSIALIISQQWRTISGRPFFTLDGTEKRWIDPVEMVESFAEIRLEDGTNARLVRYDGGEVLIVPRTSLTPIDGTRVDPAQARTWFRSAKWIK